MATLQQLIENLKQIEQELPDVLRRSAEIMANDGKALAERIIKSEGFGKLYSQRKTIPAYWLYDRAINRRGVAYLENLDDELTNWAEFRRAQGLQTNFVDLSYTARMWMGMRPNPVEERDGRFFCTMGHNDREGKDKMNWNFARYGDFIGKALEGKQEILINTAIDNITELFERYV